MSKSKRNNQGVALIIVLAFVVLLTGLSLVYFSHTASDRQLSKASFHDTSAELLAHSALDIILSSLKDRKSTRLNSSHLVISYAVFCLKKKKAEPPRHRLAADNTEDTLIDLTV